MTLRRPINGCWAVSEKAAPAVASLASLAACMPQVGALRVSGCPEAFVGCQGGKIGMALAGMGYGETTEGFSRRL